MSKFKGSGDMACRSKKQPRSGICWLYAMLRTTHARDSRILFSHLLLAWQSSRIMLQLYDFILYKSFDAGYFGLMKERRERKRLKI